MPLPSIPSPTKKPAKKTLFDDGEDDLAPVEKKVVEKKPAAKKQNLFDGQEEDFNFKPKAKVEKKKEAAKKNLFDDD